MTADSFLSMPLACEWDYHVQVAIVRLTKNAVFRYKAYWTIDYAVNREKWNASLALILCIKARICSLPLLLIREKAIWRAPLVTRRVKEDSGLSYTNVPKLLGTLKVVKIKGVFEAELKKIERCQLLILDDLFLVPLDAKEHPILLEIIEYRHERKSIIITSQHPSSNWYDMVGNTTIADAILKRIIHSAHTINLYGISS